MMCMGCFCLFFPVTEQCNIRNNMQIKDMKDTKKADSYGKSQPLMQRKDVWNDEEFLTETVALFQYSN